MAGLRERESAIDWQKRRERGGKTAGKVQFTAVSATAAQGSAAAIAATKEVKR
jgi:hypothetical protein